MLVLRPAAQSAATRSAQIAALLVILLPATLTSRNIVAQADVPALVSRMVTNEREAEQRRGLYLYTSVERSERTGGRLWKERVAETVAGKVRLLIEEDGRPLTADRLAAERARLAAIAADPEAFRRREQALKNDEHHARQMLELLPRAFLFDAPAPDGAFTRIGFHPNPAYEPQSIEERVIHAMIGTVWVDPAAARLHRIEGRMPVDVTVGFGLIATIKAGSSFSTTRDREPGDEWKTVLLDTDIAGRAIFFKAIGKKEHGEHSAFSLLPPDATVQQAVALLLK